jgi:hypothetical protein
MNFEVPLINEDASKKTSFSSQSSFDYDNVYPFSNYLAQHDFPEHVPLK